MSMTNPVHHNRPQPEAWPELLEYVQQTSPKYSIPSYPDVLKIAHRLDDLAGLELEKNTYYGYGKIMCGLAQRLQDPGTRDYLTTKMAVGIVRGARKKRRIPSKELYKPIVADLDNIRYLTGPLRNLVDDSWKELAPAERLLSRALAATTTVKRKAACKAEPSGAFTRFQQHLQPHKSALLTYIPIPKWAVGGDSMSGSTFLWRSYLVALGLGSELTPEQEATPIDMEQVRTLAKPRNFTPQAQLRLDEFVLGVGWSTDTPAVFQPSVLKTSPSSEIAAELPLVRTERLGCEALYAGRLAVEIATDILPTALEKAVTITPGQAADFYANLSPREKF
jgi:hypothetical protein